MNRVLIVLALCGCALGGAAMGVTSGSAQSKAAKPAPQDVLAQVMAAMPVVSGPDGKPSATTPENVVQRVRYLAEMSVKQQKVLRLVSIEVCE